MPLILFTSPKGGVGKTTLAAHVAAILCRRGHRVMALDLDPQNALRLHLGLSIRDDAGFMSGLGQHGSWISALVETPSGVRLLPFGSAAPPRALELGAMLMAGPELLADPVRDMLSDPDLVLLADSPPGPSAAVSAIMPLADLAVIVLLTDSGSAALIPQVIAGSCYGRGILATRMAERAGIVLNQVDLDSRLSTAVLDSAAHLLGPRLLAAICRDDALAEALADRRLLTDGAGGAAEDLALLADAVIARARLSPPGTQRAGFSALAEWGIR